MYILKNIILFYLFLIMIIILKNCEAVLFSASNAPSLDKRPTAAAFLLAHMVYMDAGIQNPGLNSRSPHN